jgi:hypothetical protein
MDRSGTIINIAGYACASLVARGPARHGPLAHPDRASTVSIRAELSCTRTGPARLAYLDIYMSG